MNFRTDLAVERQEVFKKINNISEDIPGIESEEKQISKYNAFYLPMVVCICSVFFRIFKRRYV